MNLYISPSTVQRIVTLFKTTGAVSKIQLMRRGKPAKATTSWEHITAVSYLSIKGILGCNIVRGSVNCDIFYNVTLKT